MVNRLVQHYVPSVATSQGARCGWTCIHDASLQFSALRCWRASSPMPKLYSTHHYYYLLSDALHPDASLRRGTCYVWGVLSKRLAGISGVVSTG